MKNSGRKLSMIIIFAAVMTMMAAFSSFAAKGDKEARQAYRAEASEIRSGIREINAEIKAVNAEIKELRTSFQEVRRAYRTQKQLPEGVSAAEWNQALEYQAEIKALNQAAKAAKEAAASGSGAAADPEDGEIGAETAGAEEDAAEAPTVKELAAAGNFDEALKVLEARKQTRNEKLSERKEILTLWKKIAALTK